MTTRWPRTPKGGMDAPIEGAAEPSMTVLRFVQEARRVRQQDALWYNSAAIRERVVLGEHTDGVAGSISQSSPVDVLHGQLMKENRLFPALQTLVARIDQGRIDAKAWAHTPTPARLAAAEGANLLLDAERSRQRRDMKVHESLFWALVHGESGLYTTWDESYGPVEAIEPMLGDDGLETFDPVTGLPMQQIVEEYGAIRVEVLSTFDFWTSGEDNPEDTRWQIRRRIVDRWTAKALLEKSGIYRDVADKPFETRGRNRHKRGVEVLEVWVKPGAMIKPGMFALVVDDCVCLPPKLDEHGEPILDTEGNPVVAETPMRFPFKHGRLPISVLSCMRVSDTPHGHTVTEDAIDQQMLINVALRSILHRADIAGTALFAGVDAIVDAITANKINRAKYNGPKKIGDVAAWIPGADIPEGILAVYQLAIAALPFVVGVSEESSTGGDPTSTTSGEQLKTASALDAQKTVPIRRRAECAWEEVDKQSIELARERMTKPRLATVAGDPIRAMYLEGADLNGVDVSIEQASGLAMTHAGKARTAEERTAAGLLDPVAGAEMSSTGQATTQLDELGRRRIEKQGTDALRGVPQMPLPDVDPSAAARHLRLLLGQAPAGRTAMLLQLIAMYEQHAGSMAPMPGAPAPGGTPKATPSTMPTEPTAAPEAVQ